jgi:hypothetical protein
VINAGNEAIQVLDFPPFKTARADLDPLATVVVVIALRTTSSGIFSLEHCPAFRESTATRVQQDSIHYNSHKTISPSLTTQQIRQDDP